MNLSFNTLFFEPLERIEFAFVLLPSDSVLEQLASMAAIVHELLQKATVRDTLPREWGTYRNQALRFPHLSIGQYGALADDLEALKAITHEVSLLTPALTQTMQETLSVLDDYIFFDATDCFANVKPALRDAYIHLRKRYFDRIPTRFPIKQALYAQKRFTHQTDELNLLTRYFQNWMTPEEDRMRPHFTMHYHPPFVKESMVRILTASKDLERHLKALSTIDLTRLGIFQIDTFGNPLEKGLLCVYPLGHP